MAYNDGASSGVGPAIPGLLLGIGVGGLLDGIVLHRLLGWHHLLSSEVPAVGDGFVENQRADGWFDLASLGVLLLGVVALFWWLNRRRRNAAPVSGARVLGWAVAGWGLFNVVEGTVAHLVLGVHHVNETSPGTELQWDVAFVVASALVGFLGLLWAVRRRTRERPTTHLQVPVGSRG